ncbi:MAG: hypothetical protein IJP78_12140 [Clostridia bacterium]|nr:hypothetical protein [Clostridia bacterium]
MDTEDAILFLAAKNNTTPEQIRVDMEEAIQSAKDNDNFKAMFGDRTPNVEEFIEAVVLMLRAPDGPVQ